MTQMKFLHCQQSFADTWQPLALFWVLNQSAKASCLVKGKKEVNVNIVNSEFWDETGEPEMGVSDESCVRAQKSKRNPLWVQWDEGLSTNYVILDEGGGTKIATTTKSYAFHKCLKHFLGEWGLLGPQKVTTKFMNSPLFSVLWLEVKWQWSKA